MLCIVKLEFFVRNAQIMADCYFLVTVILSFLLWNLVP